MGIVIRQSFWTSIVTYLGVAVGYINSLILFPYFLDTEEIGLIRQLQAGALLLVPLASLGISNTIVKFHPQFSESQRSKSQFFTLMLSGAIFGFLVSFLIILIFTDPIKSFFATRSALVNDYFYVILTLLFILSLTSVFRTYLMARMEIVFSNFVNGVLIRVLVAISILLFGLNFIGFTTTVNSIILIYGIALLAHMAFAYTKEPYSISSPAPIISSGKLPSIVNYSAFSILGSASNVILLNIDILMVTGLAGLSQTGIYTTAFYIGLVIEMPRRAISQISIPIISSALNKNDHQTVKQHYRRVSINQLIIGALLFLGIVVNLDNIYALIPNNEEFVAGMPVVIIIGLAKLIDMTFSQNSEILMLSKYYRFNVVTVLILGIVTVILNYLLIPAYGITGAAIASLIALLIFNLVKFSFVWAKFGFQPFSKATLIVLVLGSITYLIVSQIPFIYSIIPDIVVRSIAVSGLLMGPILLLKISPEINDTTLSLLRRFKL